jgi:serine/threonine protein kinase
MTASLLKDRYELLRKLGSGGFSTVFAALDTLLDREVAIKILKASLHEDKELVQRFLLEAKLTSKLTHPNALTVHDFGRDDKGHCFFVTELLIGQSLHDRLYTQPLTLTESLSVVHQIASALGEAHSKEIVHRDIKPGNIFLCVQTGKEEPLVKLLDFGIAKSVGFDGQTVTGQMMGTPTYMSPEQIVNIKDVDHRSDVYSLGIVFYHMICGVPPFKGDSYFDTMRMHMQSPLPKVKISGFNDEICASLISLLNKMTHKDKYHRYADANALIQAIINVQTLILRSDLSSQQPHISSTTAKELDRTSSRRTEEKTQKSEPFDLSKFSVGSEVTPQPRSTPQPVPDPQPKLTPQSRPTPQSVPSSQPKLTPQIATPLSRSTPEAVSEPQIPKEASDKNLEPESNTDPFGFLREANPIDLDTPPPLDPFAIHTADARQDYQLIDSASSSIKLKLPSTNVSSKGHTASAQEYDYITGSSRPSDNSSSAVKPKVNAEFTYAAGRDAHLSQIAPSPAKVFRILILDPNEYASNLYRKGLIAGADRRAKKRYDQGILSSDMITVSISTTEKALIEDLDWGADLILVDLKARDGIRESEGISLIQSLQSLCPKKCHIIALCKDTSLSGEAINAGADAVLNKPVRNHQLFDAVAVYLWNK